MRCCEVGLVVGIAMHLRPQHCQPTGQAHWWAGGGAGEVELRLRLRLVGTAVAGVDVNGVTNAVGAGMRRNGFSKRCDKQLSLHAFLQYAKRRV